MAIETGSTLEILTSPFSIFTSPSFFFISIWGIFLLQNPKIMTFDLSWLDTTPVTSITLKRTGKKGVVVLPCTVTVVEALNTLVAEEILSAPVWDDVKNTFVANLVRERKMEEEEQEDQEEEESMDFVQLWIS